MVAITSFMTGAAISIGAGQVPALMGISGVNNRGPTYLVIIDTLKGLPRTKLDAAMGLSALAMLYIIRSFCNFMARKQPTKKKLWFFVSHSLLPESNKANKPRLTLCAWPLLFSCTS